MIDVSERQDRSIKGLKAPFYAKDYAKDYATDYAKALDAFRPPASAGRRHAAGPDALLHRVPQDGRTLQALG
jgi:hypothetical protein